MSEVLYAWGYAKRMVNMKELKRLAHFDEMEPEAAERFEAWLVSRQGQIGIGSSIRSFQPVKPGFAPPGMSFHLPVLFNDGRVEFMALDLVCPNGENVHRSPRWDEVPRQGSGHPDISKYGVHCNVNGEPWHMQVIEVDGFQTWVNAGRKHPNPNFPIYVAPEAPVEPPVTPQPIPEPEPPIIHFNPAVGVYGNLPFVSKPNLGPGSKGDATYYLQGNIKNEISRFANWFYITRGVREAQATPEQFEALRLLAEHGSAIVVDGDYGGHTAICVTLMITGFQWTSFDNQQWGDIGGAPYVTPNTWAFVDAQANKIWAG